MFPYTLCVCVCVFVASASPSTSLSAIITVETRAPDECVCESLLTTLILRKHRVKTLVRGCELLLEETISVPPARSRTLKHPPPVASSLATESSWVTEMCETYGFGGDTMDKDYVRKRLKCFNNSNGNEIGNGNSLGPNAHTNNANNNGTANNNELGDNSFPNTSVTPCRGALYFANVKKTSMVMVVINVVFHDFFDESPNIHESLTIHESPMI